MTLLTRENTSHIVITKHTERKNSVQDIEFEFLNMEYWSRLRNMGQGLLAFFFSVAELI